jgi:SAM-dependent methyltransferase
MLRHADPAPGRRVQADAFRLPLPDAVADAIVLVNALLFPREMARVLAPDGALVWVNSLGDRTPIHLSADDVERAMPGGWTGVAAEAGWGTWCTLRRREAAGPAR